MSLDWKIRWRVMIFFLISFITIAGFFAPLFIENQYIVADSESVFFIDDNTTQIDGERYENHPNIQTDFDKDHQIFWLKNGMIYNHYEYNSNDVGACALATAGYFTVTKLRNLENYNCGFFIMFVLGIIVSVIFMSYVIIEVNSTSDASSLLSHKIYSWYYGISNVIFPLFIFFIFPMYALSITETAWSIFGIVPISIVMAVIYHNNIKLTDMQVYRIMRIKEKNKKLEENYKFL